MRRVSTNLQNQNRLLTGQVEELTNAIRQEKRSTRELYTSIDERLGKFEPREVEVNGEKVMVQPQEQPPTTPPSSFFKAGDYKKAARRIQHFRRRVAQVRLRGRRRLLARILPLRP